MSKSSGTESLETPFEKHPIHYFEDGNIIFILEDSICFKLYRGAISRHSEVLSDMLGIPQPDVVTQKDQMTSSDMQEFVDGVPAVRLTDKAESFSALLDIILPSVTTEYYATRMKGATTATAHSSLDSIGGVLELARKYGVPVAESWAKMSLKNKFKFIGPDAREFVMSDALGDSFTSAREATKLIRLARVHDLTEYLPLALYYLVTNTKLDTIFQDNLLSPEDQARLFTGRRKLTEEIMEMAVNRPENGIARSQSCRTRSINGRMCISGSAPMETIWEPQETLRMWADLINDPIDELRWRYENWDSHEGNFCKTCSNKIRDGFVEDRKVLFTMLDQIFSI